MDARQMWEKPVAGAFRARLLELRTAPPPSVSQHWVRGILTSPRQACKKDVTTTPGQPTRLAGDYTYSSSPAQCIGPYVTQRH